MRRIFLVRAALGLLLVALWTSSLVAATWQVIERIPGQLPVKVVVDGKPRSYFRTSPGKPLVVKVDGAARLRITSRAEFSDRAGLVSYTLRVLEGKREIERQETETAPSSRVQDDRGRPVGKSRRMTVDVQNGRHELQVAVEGVGSALVRLHVAAPRRGEEPTVTLTPVEAARSVLIAEGEKTIPYYSVMAGKPVRLRLVGPTSLELLTRLDFDSSMRGAHAYRLVVRDNGRRLREIAFTTTKATTATYTNLKDRVPSKFDRVVIPVGDGTHELTIELLSPAGGVAEIHARIPTPSTGEEE